MQGECDQTFGATFEFEAHAKELIVGEIFVRVYNEQPTFPLEVTPLYIKTSIFSISGSQGVVCGRLVGRTHKSGSLRLAVIICQQKDI